MKFELTTLSTITLVKNSIALEGILYEFTTDGV